METEAAGFEAAGSDFGDVVLDVCFVGAGRAAAAVFSVADAFDVTAAASPFTEGVGAVLEAVESGLAEIGVLDDCCSGFGLVAFFSAADGLTAVVPDGGFSCADCLVVFDAADGVEDPEEDGWFAGKEIFTVCPSEEI